MFLFTRGLARTHVLWDLCSSVSGHPGPSKARERERKKKQKALGINSSVHNPALRPPVPCGCEIANTAQAAGCDRAVVPCPSRRCCLFLRRSPYRPIGWAVSVSVAHFAVPKKSVAHSLGEFVGDTVTETEGEGCCGSPRTVDGDAGYGDLGRALLDLQAAADQVFDTVSKRTAEEREKLSAISMRIKAAKAKIKALSQSEEPLTIVSPALHPSSSTKQEDYRPLFHDKHGLPIATIAVNGGFNREYGLEGTLELFQFFSEENCDYPSTSKPTDKFPKTKDGTYLENLLQTAKYDAGLNWADSILQFTSSSADFSRQMISQTQPLCQPPPPPETYPSSSGNPFGIWHQE